MTEYIVPDGPKMLRETLCIAQLQISEFFIGDRKYEHMARLQRLINACDYHRPLGPDGKHGNLHTDSCGCEDVVKTGRGIRINKEDLTANHPDMLSVIRQEIIDAGRGIDWYYEQKEEFEREMYDPDRQIKRTPKEE